MSQYTPPSPKLLHKAIGKCHSKRIFFTEVNSFCVKVNDMPVINALVNLGKRNEAKPTGSYDENIKLSDCFSIKGKGLT